MTVRRLGEGSWIAADYPRGYTPTMPGFFVLWVPTGDDGDGNPTGDVLRYVDRSYQARVR